MSGKYNSKIFLSKREKYRIVNYTANDEFEKEYSVVCISSYYSLEEAKKILEKIKKDKKLENIEFLEIKKLEVYLCPEENYWYTGNYIEGSVIEKYWMCIPEEFVYPAYIILKDIV
ncbi:MAG: hypothetical protein ACRDDH_02795 [Cetobacterium sp.]|uniref:hypothetical protein n=1 Tax=Cetobacterium sp. TaxID=2071632 RepID=UPI003EE61E5D